MNGECVTVYEPTVVGLDAYGDKVRGYEPHVVDDVLVRPLSGSDSGDADRPDGVRVEYALAFPKSYDGPALRGCKVALTDRGMTEEDALWVSGSPDVVSPCPTRWNMNVEVGRTHG